MVLMGGPIDTRGQSDRGQYARRAARHRLVPPQRHHQGAVPQSGLHARRLSGLPAAPRLREHESRSPYRGAPQPVPPSRRKAMAIPRRSIANSTTNISRSWICAAEFYLQTVETVFVRHALPKGEMTHRGVRVDPAKIRRVALLTVEGENDDISGVGQTEAAHRLCVNIPARAQGALAAARASVITACSTARVSAPRSCRASPTSCCRTTPLARAAARARSRASSARPMRAMAPRMRPPAAAVERRRRIAPAAGTAGRDGSADRFIAPDIAASRVQPRLCTRFVTAGLAACIAANVLIL